MQQAANYRASETPSSTQKTTTLGLIKKNKTTTLGHTTIEQIKKDNSQYPNHRQNTATT